MAVSTPTIPLPKGEPDITKLNTFTGHTVQVTKYQQPRGGMGSTLVTPTEMPLPEILRLMTSLPIINGPGFYKFTVSDTGGVGDDVWMTKLGPDTQEAQVAAVQTAINGTSGGPPVSEGVRNLGHGFMYDMSTGLLTTPWRQIVQWSEGQPLPQAPAQLGGAASTPWSGGGQGQGGWGAWPAIDTGDSTRVKQLEAQLTEQNRQREMDRLRDDIRLQQEATNKAIMALAEKLTARPTGPSEETRVLEARLADETRRREESERRAADEARELRRQQEMREMEARFERSMRELAGNKTDPMLPLLANMLTSMQATSAETIRAIKETTESQASAASQGVQLLVQHLSSNAVSPVQLMGMIAAAKGDGAEATRTILGTAKDALAMQKDFFGQMLDVANQGGQPAWVGVASAALEKIGTIGAALAERNAQQAQAQQQQQQAQQRQQRQPQQFRPMTVASQPQVSQMNGTPALNPSAPIVIPPHPGADRPGRVDTGDRPEGTKYDTASDTFILTDGRRVKHSDVVANGWKAVLTNPHEFMTAQATSIVQPPAGPTLVSVPTENVMPPVSAKRGRPKKPKDVPPPPVDPAGYSIAEMREHSSDEIELVCRKLTDEDFFGPTLFPYVQQLRAASLAPGEVAEQIVKAREQMISAKLVMPPAMEVLEALHVEVVIDRLLPDHDDGYRSAVVDGVEGLMGVEEDDESGDAA